MHFFEKYSSSRNRVIEGKTGHGDSEKVIIPADDHVSWRVIDFRVFPTDLTQASFQIGALSFGSIAGAAETLPDFDSSNIFAMAYNGTDPTGAGANTFSRWVRPEFLVLPFVVSCQDLLLSVSVNYAIVLERVNLSTTKRGLLMLKRSRQQLMVPGPV
jgi:hypothetical protein